MIEKFKFTVRQLLKMLLQNVLLPCAYNFWNWIYRKKEPNLIIFADAHHTQLPYSMQYIHNVLVEKGYSVTDVFYNFPTMSAAESTWVSLRFMKQYARAKYVFICDNFLPVVSCKKNKRTTVIQLWHCCGLLKKMGHDTTEDIPAYYKGEIYRNYDLVTVSAPSCVKPLAKAMRLPEEVLKPLGVSRTDAYFDPLWQARCTEAFYSRYPQAKGKKVVLWAPTFRGSASAPYQIGTEAILQLEQQLGDEYFVIRKVHPHIDTREHLSNCDIVTEQLFPITDLLITDYSTVMHEFLFFRKPYVLFAPDLEEYQEKRGFYIEYASLSPYLVTEPDALCYVVQQALQDTNPEWVEKNRIFHASACDGNTTERILEAVGL